MNGLNIWQSHSLLQSLLVLQHLLVYVGLVGILMDASDLVTFNESPSMLQIQDAVLATVRMAIPISPCQPTAKMFNFDQSHINAHKSTIWQANSRIVLLAVVRTILGVQILDITGDIRNPNIPGKSPNSACGCSQIDNPGIPPSHCNSTNLWNIRGIVQISDNCKLQAI